MDPLKDTNKDGISNGQQENTMSDKGQIRFVNMDSFVSFIEKKTEQIATALYLISDSIDERDPIRHRFREKAIELVGVGKSLNLLSPVEKHFEFHALRAAVLEVISLLRVAATVGEISSMNANILENECKKVNDGINVVLEEESASGYQNPSLGEGAVASFTIGGLIEDERKQVSDASQPSEVRKTEALAPESKRQVVSDKMDAKNDTSKKTYKTTERSSNDIATHHIRRQSIVKILSQSQASSLSDIKAVIPDVSEKTIQRELMSLIEEGVVLKSGDKRWARYSLR